MIPTTDRDKDTLLEAGLRECKVVIPDVECSAEEFRQVLLEVFPKLSDAGGYLFLASVKVIPIVWRPYRPSA